MPASLRIRVEDGGVRVLLSEMARRVEPGPMLRTFSEVMQTSIDETFRQEGYPAGSWRRLHASSLARAFERGGRSSRRRDGRNTKGFLRYVRGRRILTDSGALRRSIQSDIRGSRLVIGSALVYARIHQLGGVIEAKRGGMLRIPLAGGLTIFRRKVTIPARPFLLIKPEDIREMTKAGESFIAAAEGGAR